MLLLVVDACSKWLEAFAVTSTASSTAIQCLRALFARFGRPNFTKCILTSLWWWRRSKVSRVKLMTKAPGGGNFNRVIRYVYVHNFRPGGALWLLGRVTEMTGPVSYKVHVGMW